MTAVADRHLLFGLLALQNGVINLAEALEQAKRPAEAETIFRQSRKAHTHSGLDPAEPGGEESLTGCTNS